MTKTSNRLAIRKFSVFAKGSRIYFQTFHNGLNVIRGDHAVGKSTLLDLIFFSLGGELKKDQWVYPADHCDSVCIEVELSEKIFCFKRNIEVGSIPPIDVFEGTYEEGMQSLVGWQSYGPRRTDRKNSFSQLVFDLIGWGNSKTDDYANLTMHQILRLLYVDQETPANKIFRAEPPNSDSESLRLAIAEFMLSLDDLEMHRARQDLLVASKKFDKVDAELSAIYEVLGRDSSYNSETLYFEINEIKSDIRSLESKRVELYKGEPSSKSTSADEIPGVKELSDEINRISSSIAEKDIKLGLYISEISDCTAFGASLEIRKSALLESKLTYESIGGVTFKQCPCCQREIELSSEQEFCLLCKTPSTIAEGGSPYLQILSELEFQQKQNNKLLADLKNKLAIESAVRRADDQELNIKKALLKSIIGSLTDREAEVIEISRRIGFSESQINNLTEKIEIIQKVDRLKKDKINYSKEITELYDLMERLKAASKARKDRVLNSITSLALKILELDEKYEAVFKKATSMEAEIDFGKDRWLVDGRSKFSGSSNFFKKNALHVAMMHYSLVDKKCRYPRFLILDAIENGGMTTPRSQNFQRIVNELFKDKEDQYQIILSTAMVDPHLDNEIYGVGQKYKKEEYVLQIPEN